MKFEIKYLLVAILIVAGMIGAYFVGAYQGYSEGIEQTNIELDFYREYAKFPFSQGLYTGMGATFLEMQHLFPEQINTIINDWNQEIWEEKFSPGFLAFMGNQNVKDENGIMCWLASTGEYTILRGEEELWNEKSEKCSNYFENIPKPSKEGLGELFQGI